MMATTIRNLRRYDHRLRELVRSSDSGRLWTLEAKMGNDYAEMYPAVLGLLTGGCC